MGALRHDGAPPADDRRALASAGGAPRRVFGGHGGLTRLTLILSTSLLLLLRGTCSDPRGGGDGSEAVRRLEADEAARRLAGLPARCFWDRDSLSKEIRGRVTTGPGLVEADGIPPHGVDKRFPYSNSYCARIPQDHLRFRPEGCHLDSFDPEAFLQLFRGRRLVFWGDSVSRQFFAYLAVRLRGLAPYNPRIARDKWYRSARNCTHYMNSIAHGLTLRKDCFEARGAHWEDQCYFYHGGNTSMCFIRTEREVVTDRNIIFLNELGPNDIVMFNVGVHFNWRRMFNKVLRNFSSLLGYLAKTGRELPLVLWRDTSPQHFRGGEGGNFPIKGFEKMRRVNRQTFRCAKHSYRKMRGGDWRNKYLRNKGVQWFQKHNLAIPILRTWNVTAMLSHKHPQLLADNTTIADCTHYCPNIGGVFELWAELMQNFLGASLRHEHILRPSPRRSRAVVQQTAATAAAGEGPAPKDSPPNPAQPSHASSGEVSSTDSPPQPLIIRPERSRLAAGNPGRREGLTPGRTMRTGVQGRGKLSLSISRRTSRPVR